MRVVCVGDVMLDVLVRAPGGFVPDDDAPASITLAPGGQAANVAAWVVALGGRAHVLGPRGRSGSARLVEEALRRRGVEVTGPYVERSGVVVSMLTGEQRSLASDPGDVGWLDDVRPGAWLDETQALFVSGYTLVRAAEPGRLVELAARARAAGARVAVDLSSAAMATAFGAAGYRALWEALRPDVVLGNDREWAVAGYPASPARGVVVVKHGARGATFVSDGVAEHRDVVPGPVLDATGAGDALAAGYLVGGPDLAMRAAARCVARLGAQPPEEAPP